MNRILASASPATWVVMENIIRQDTVGKVEQTSVKCDLLKRGSYTWSGRPVDSMP
jgi:hypothetical protein